MWALLLVLVAGCARAPELARRLAALAPVVDQARRQGASRCAPRELSIAQSQLAFARLELEQGFFSKAERHFERAEPNAHAALFLSPPEHCAESSSDEPPPVETDPDLDGLDELADQCVLEREDRDGYLDDDGCPELDNDLDGAPDTEDRCPLAAEDPDGHEDEDGCPDPDNDADGVLDSHDHCPGTPGSSTGRDTGCAARDVGAPGGPPAKVTR